MPVPILTAWHVVHAVLTVIGALSVCSSVLLLWAARRVARREDARRRREFDARLEVILREGAGDAL